MTRRRAGMLPVLLGLLALALPAPAAAAGLTITTPYPAINVGPGGTATFNLTVTTASPERVALAVTKAPSSWTTTLKGGGFVIAAVQTLGNGPVPTGATQPTVELDVKVPTDATAGTYEVDVQGTASDGSTATLPVQLAIRSSSTGTVTMTPDFPSLKGTTTSTFTFNLTVDNETPQKINFNLQAQGPDGWTVDAHPSGSSQAVTMSVDAGSTGTVNVTANPPSSTQAGTYDVTVTAAGGPQPLQTKLQVILTGSPALTLSTPNGTLNATVTAGGTGTFTVTVQNTGSAPLSNITMSDTPPTGWNVSFSDPTIATLGPNQTKNVTVTVKPASDALAGDYDLTVSAGAASANGNVHIRTTVQTSPIWGLVGLVLIVLVLVGLAWVFRRYGRR